MKNVFVKPNSGFGIRLEALMKQEGIDISKKGANADLARKMIKNESLSFLVNEDMRKRVETARSRIENHRKTDSAENIEGKWLKAYCDFFKCSADYLFGHIDFPTHTSTDISNETGLSENAIKMLHNFTTYPQGKIRLAVIDFLLRDVRFSLSLTDMINGYYEEYYYYTSYKAKYDQEEEKERKMKQEEFFAYISDTNRAELGKRRKAMDAALFGIQNEFNRLLDDLMKRIYQKNNG